MVAVALLATAVSALIGSFVLGRVPHVTDGVSYLFQARVFASGHLSLKPEPEPALFQQMNTLDGDGRWCSLYPPGWPAILAVGVLLGAPWLVNPLLLGLSIVGVWRLALRLYDGPTAVLAAAALAASPFALLMSGSFMAHPAMLCATIWCLVLLAEGTLSGSLGSLVAAGLLAGLALLIRPFSALTLLAPAAAWSSLKLRRPAAVGALALGLLPGVVGFLVYDRVVFGGFLVTGYALYEPEQFSTARAMTVSWTEATTLALPWYLRELGRGLWGIGSWSLALFLPLLWPRPRGSRDLMLAACAALLVFGHCFYFYRDVVYGGPRFAFEALGPLSVLVARSLWFVSALLATLWRKLSPATATPATRRLLAGAAVGMALYLPLAWRLPREMARHSGWYRMLSGEPLRRATAAGIGSSALVFVDSRPPWASSSLFLSNSLRPAQGGRVFVHDIPRLRAAALALYPRDEVWWLRLRFAEPGPGEDLGNRAPTELSWQRLR